MSIVMAGVAIDSDQWCHSLSLYLDDKRPLQSLGPALVNHVSSGDVDEYRDAETAVIQIGGERITVDAGQFSKHVRPWIEAMIAD